MKPALAACLDVVGRIEQKRQTELITAVNDTGAVTVNARTDTRDQCLDVHVLNVDCRVLRDSLNNCTVTRKEA